ncbi:MAG: beta-lactamase family protein [Paludibacteraceae bacterium]|nr:beta-lactamase family protein [Paludibacteraceae bacterium]
MKRLPLFVFVIVFVNVIVSCSRTSVAPEVRELDSICCGLFPAGEPGASVLVMRHDSVLFNCSYGLADMQTRQPITDSTSFCIASVSKQFTSVALLQLAEQGRLSLNDAVAQHMPYPQAFWKEVRLRHLLAHSSGVPDERGYLSREEKIRGTDSLAVAYLPRVKQLHFSPGSCYEYINPTFVLAGNIVEKVSGEPFADYMQQHVFAPADMQAVYFDPDHQDLIPRMAHGYAPEDDGTWSEYDYGEETFFATRADGALYTSTRDFVKWEQALRKRKVLSEEFLNQAWTPQTRVTGSEWCDYQNRENTGYGLGWFIEPKTDSKRLCIYHTGDNGGFQILAARYPEDEGLVLVFSNRHDWDRQALKLQIEQIFGF